MAASSAYAFAPAKINLFLHVLGRRDDGFHELESLAVFAGVGDELTASPAEDWGLHIDGPFASGLRGMALADNLVIRAAKAVEGVSPLEFTLTKNLPVASGIGGGSADAAAAIRLAFAAAARTPDMSSLAATAKLGADVPVCLASTPAWMRGVGEQLMPAVLPGPLHMVLVNAGTPVSTPGVFKAWANHMAPREALAPLPTFASQEELFMFLEGAANDLTEPARALVPEIGLVLAAIEGTEGCRLTRLSGSGGTCFGLYRDEASAKAAAASLSEANPDWWVKAANSFVADPADQWVRLITNSTRS